MSKTIDEKVVKLSFDNRQFEHNVKESMSTLDKLKQALTFKKSADGLEEVSKSINKMSFNPITNGVEQVKTSFNALEIVAITALQKITNQAVDVGERLVKNLTVDQISAGWQKYEDKTSAVQTIMAATSKQFDDENEQIEKVNESLERLNWFTDETSYSFVDMTGNIGKFTSNGQDLDKSVRAMQGIANWAAISGANTQEASRAMYNLSQALAVGSVKLIDWKSISNANMATVEFKETAIETAEAMGMLKKAGDGLWKTLDGTEVTVAGFDQTLSKGWFSSDVLMETLDRYGSIVDQIKDAADQTGILTASLVKAATEYGTTGTKAKEYNKAWAAANKEGLVTAEEFEAIIRQLGSAENALGLKAFKAAQETKTLSEAISYAKEAVSTGWMNTFELVFGGYTEAKGLFSELAENLYEIFVVPIEDRNDLITEVLSEGAFDLDKRLEECGYSMNELADVVGTTMLRQGKGVWDGLLDDAESFTQAIKDGIVSTDDLSEGLRRLADKDAWAVTKSLNDMLGFFKSYGDLTKKFSIEGLRESYDDRDYFFSNMVKMGEISLEDFADALDEMSDKGEWATKAMSDLDECLREIGHDFDKDYDEIIKKNKSLANAIRAGEIDTKWLGESLAAMDGTTRSATQSFATLTTEFSRWAEHTELYDVDALTQEYGSLGRALAAGKISVKDFGTVLQTLSKYAGENEDAVQDLRQAVLELYDKKGLNVDNLLDVTDFSNAVAEGLVDIDILAEALNSMDNSIYSSVAAFEDYKKAVDDIWTKNLYGSGEARIKALTEAGFDAALVQEMVNEYVATGTITEEKYAEKLSKVAGASSKRSAMKIKDRQRLLRLSQDMEYLQSLTDRGLSGKEMIAEIFSDTMNGLTAIIVTFRDAWKDLSHVDATSIVSVIGVVHRFGLALRDLTDEDTGRLEELSRAFKGLISIFHLFQRSIQQIIRGSINQVRKALGLFSGDILGTAANIGDMLVAFEEWWDSNQFIVQTIDMVGDAIAGTIGYIIQWVKAMLETEEAQAVISDLRFAWEYLVNYFTNDFPVFIQDIRDFIAAFLETQEVQDVIADIKTFAENAFGIIIAVVGTASETLVGFIGNAELFHDTMERILPKAFLSAMDKAKATMADVKSAADASAESFKNVGETVSETSENVKSSVSNMMSEFRGKLKRGENVSNIIAIMLGAGSIAALSKTAKFLTKFKLNLDPISKLLDRVTGSIKNFGKAIKAKTFLIYVDIIKTFAIAVGILAASIYALGSMNKKDLAIGTGVILVLIAAMGVLVKLVSGMAKQMSAMKTTESVGKTVTAASTILAIAGSLVLLTIAVKMLVKTLDGVDQKVLGNTIFILGGMIAAMIGVIYVLAKFPLSEGTKAVKAGGTLLAISISVNLLVFALKSLVDISSKMSARSLNNITTVLTAFIVITGVITKAAIAAKDSIRGARALGLSAIGMILLLKALKKIADFDMNLIYDNMMNFIILIGVYVGLSRVITKNEGTLVKAGSTVIGVAASMMLLAVAAKILSTIKPTKLIGAAVAIGIMLVAMSTVVKSLKAAENEVSMKVGLSVLAVAGAIIMLTGALVVLSMVDPKGLMRATFVVSTLMVVLGAVLHFANLGSVVEGARKPITALGAVLLVLVVSLAALSMIKDERSINAAVGALIKVMLSLTALFAILRYLPRDIGKTTIATIGLIGVIIASLSGIMYVLASLPSQNVVAASNAMLKALVGISAVLFAISRFDVFTAMSMEMIKLIGLALVEVGGLLIILPTLYKTLGITPEEVNATANAALKTMGGIARLLIAMSVLVKASAGAIAFMTVAGPIALAIGAFISIFNMFVNSGRTFRKKNTSVMEQAGDAISGFLSKIISSFGEGFGKGILSIGEGLGGFTEKSKPFFEMIGGVDDATVTGAKNLADSILALEKANFVNFLNGGTDYSKLGDTMADIGKAVVVYHDSLGTFTESDAAVVEASAEAFKNVVESLNKIPKTDGLAQAIFGQTDFEAFGKKLVGTDDNPGFVKTMLGFVESVTGLKNGDIDKASIAADVVEEMSRMIQRIPTSGSIKELWEGSPIGTADFSYKINNLGQSIISFGNIASMITDDQLDGISKASEAMENIGSILELVPEDGGVKQWWNGSTSDGLSTLGTSLGAFITNLTESMPAANDVDDESFAKVCSMISSLGEAFGLIDENKLSIMDQFSSSIPTLFGAITDFMKIGDSDDSETQTAVTSIASALMTGMGDGIEAQTPSVLSKITAMIAAIKAEFSTEENIYSFQAIGGLVTDSIAEGFTKAPLLGKSPIEVGAKDLAAGAIDALEKAIGHTNSATASEFFKLGEYSAQGYVEGLKAHVQDAIDAASTFGDEAWEALRKSINARSPAKRFYLLGEYSTQGYTNAVVDGTSDAVKAATNMGDMTINGLTSSISKIADAINTDIDTSPTIRPVLDLSDIQSKGKNISKYIDANYSVGLAQSTSAAVSKSKSASDSGVDPAQQTSNITFTQNNYSPKALSRMEIYRQTKNQFAMLKGSII